MAPSGGGWISVLLFLAALVFSCLFSKDLSASLVPADVQSGDKLLVIYEGEKFMERKDPYTNYQRERELVCHIGKFEAERGTYTVVDGKYIFTSMIKDIFWGPHSSKSYSLVEISKMINKGQVLVTKHESFSDKISSFIHQWQDEKSHLEKGDIKVDQRWVPKNLYVTVDNLIKSNAAIQKEDSKNFLDTVTKQWKTISDQRNELPDKLYQSAKKSIRTRIENAFKAHFYSQAETKSIIREASLERRASDELFEMFRGPGRHASLNQIVEIISAVNVESQALKQIKDYDWLDDGPKQRFYNAAVDLLKKREELKSKIDVLERDVKMFVELVNSFAAEKKETKGK